MVDDKQIAALEARVANLERKLTMIGTVIVGAKAGAAGPAGPVAPAPPSELDSKFGDPDVRFVPKSWKGTNFKGHKFSQCDPEFLDQLAETLEYFAVQNDEKGEKAKNGKPKSSYDRIDAARARGWAKRIRGGWKSPISAVPASGGTPAWMGAQPAAPAAGDEGNFDDDALPF